MKYINKNFQIIVASVFSFAFVFCGSLFSSTANADVVVVINSDNFPDPIFREYVSDNCDVDKDGLLNSYEMQNVTEIDVFGSNISDLKGIEYFSELTYLNCNSNQLTELDVSYNSSLRDLHCDSNQLTTLDVSNNLSLEWLDCGRNELTSIDVSNNRSLYGLTCSDNHLTSLNVDYNSDLKWLSCQGNQLASLDVHNNTDLISLGCSENLLTTLDLSKNTALNYLFCGNNRLKTLNVSMNTALLEMDCQYNQLKKLDLSNNHLLEDLCCTNNQLTTLIVSKNSALIELRCNNNMLGSLDVSDNTSLAYLDCKSNKLTALDVSNDNALTILNCAENLLTELDISNFTALTDLGCDGNQLTKLDVSNDKALNCLVCNNNKLTTLNLDKCVDLEELYVDNNDLDELNIDSCKNLTTLDCRYNYLKVKPQVENLLFDPQKKHTYTITLEKTTNGTAELSSTSALEGDEVIVSATPDPGYYVKAIKVDGDVISGNSFVFPDKNVKIEVEFEKHIPLEITKQPSIYYGNIGETAVFTVEARGDNLSYQWKTLISSQWVNLTLPGSNTPSLSMEINKSNEGKWLCCEVTDVHGNVEDTIVVFIEIYKPTTIKKQPEDFTGSIGSTASFTVEADGNGLNYRWQVKSSDMWHDSSLPGSNQPTLSVPITAARNGYKFRCVVTGMKGTAVSLIATLNVTADPPSITTQPTDYSGLLGSTASFKVVATGTGLKYQWQAYSSGKWVNSSLSGAKTATLSVPVTNARNGYKFRCVITDKFDQKVTSNTVTLKVKATPVSITTQPKDFSGAVGSTAKFTVAAQGGTGIKYQWQAYSGGKWVNSSLSGAKTATLSVPVTYARNGYKFRCVITDAFNRTMTSDAATLKVNTTPLSILTQPKSYTGDIGTIAKFTVKAQGTGLKYQWQAYTNGKWANSSLSGAKTATLSVPVTAARNGYKFRCVITDASGKTVTSNAVTLKVAAVALSITTQPKNYSGAVGSTATFKVVAQGTGLKYQWQAYSGGKWINSSLTGAKTATLSVPVTKARNGYKFRCLITDSSGKTVTSNEVILTIK